MQETFLTPFLRARRERWRLQNCRNGIVLAHHIIPAFDSRTRRTGLLGRRAFEQGHAMIIAPTTAIHTFFMRFPIDVAFLARDGTVVKISASLKPWRAAGVLRGFAVVELPAGTLAACDTVAGDRLALVIGP